MKDHLIEVKGLSKVFGFKGAEQPAYALKEINLAIPRGSIYGIIGMSGAGKSTLLRCLTGLESPSEGSILIEGEELTQKSAKDLCRIRQHMGMVFQHFQLFSSRTVAENIAYPMEIHGTPHEQQQHRIDELLSLIGLSHKKHMYPSQLSGGEKQRVGIARALANNPHLLLCDEPTSALDPKTTRSILQFLAQLNQELGLTVIIITHQLETVKQICHRVAVLSHGEIAEEGEVRNVFTRPQHQVTRHLLHLGTDQFPEDLLQQRDTNKKLVRLGFEGHQAKEPVISHLLKRYDVEVNILSGGLDYLQKTIVGNLFVEISGSPDDIQQALEFLQSRQIICEVIS
ncbi:Methionine import ATP-binding protein [Candidatus Protochlamydia naegleriophila]|uniref:Cell division ATP-binding protein FtsE n=1 Tax=Candidatus Protochlamydia naegleriophila TaxID=389348 RepID=A0A0U5JFB2_9BACT|nr:ATP-binding cassette domain-containing protein [Candidatus Protochlamydia naegleriophila]CUI17514.1 Methionine import ATP-binding protein [Candidatus Protochlamydia naegleriophila]